MWCDLYEELIVEIFTRLPAKSLLRFRSVSKSLCACISSPAFIRLHTLRSPKKVMIVHQACIQGAHYLIYSTSRGKEFSNFTYTLHSRGQLSRDPYISEGALEYPFRNFGIVGSCNGIICLHEYKNGICLWNPSIRCKVIVPDCPYFSDCDGQPRPLGFGFDPVVDDYKILTSAGRCKTEKGYVVSTFVYTMKTDTWREIASLDTPYHYSLSPQCLFNGALHWVVTRYLPDDHRYYYILTFNLSYEVFSTIELPEPSWETNQVAIISGSLAVISFKDYDDCWIWVRNNTDVSWILAYKMKIYEFKGAQRVFQRTANDDLLFSPFLSGITVVHPNIGKRSGFVSLSGFWCVCSMTPCVDSLELLDMGTSCDQGRRKDKRMGKSEI